MSEVVPESEIAEKVKAIIDDLPESDIVNLTRHYFDRVPCSKRRLYAVVRKYAEQWGYEYDKSEYRPSGNRPFQRNHRRGYTSGPCLRKIKGTQS